MVFPLVVALEFAADDDGGGAARLSPDGPPRCGIVGGIVLLSSFSWLICVSSVGGSEVKNVGLKGGRVGVTVSCDRMD